MLQFIHSLRLRIRAELEAPPGQRRLGSGWMGGVGALVLAVACLLLVISLRHPGLLGIPELRVIHAHPAFRVVLQVALIGSFLLATLNLVLRPRKTLGTWAMILTLSATLLGGSSARAAGDAPASLFVGLDWFVLNVIFTGFLFAPLERLFPHRRDQALFRTEWREDLFYYLGSSMLVQVITWLSFAIHFPVLDRMFGTFHWPEKRWPEGYGIQGEPMPQGCWRQFLYPFKQSK